MAENKNVSSFRTIRPLGKYTSTASRHFNTFKTVSKPLYSNPNDRSRVTFAGTVSNMFDGGVVRNVGSNFFHLLFVMLLSITIFRALHGAKPITFYEVLNILSKTPQIDLGWTSVINFSLGDIVNSSPALFWLSPLVVVFDFIVDLFRVQAFAGTAVVNVLLAIGYLLPSLLNVF